MNLHSRAGRGDSSAGLDADSVEPPPKPIQSRHPRSRPDPFLVFESLDQTRLDRFESRKGIKADEFTPDSHFFFFSLHGSDVSFTHLKRRMHSFEMVKLSTTIDSSFLFKASSSRSSLIRDSKPTLPHTLSRGRAILSDGSSISRASFSLLREMDSRLIRASNISSQTLLTGSRSGKVSSDSHQLK